MRVLTLLFAAACATAQPPADLNALARRDYAEAKQRALQAMGPVLVVGPAQIALLDGAAREQLELAPKRYHALKTIDHLALGLHALYFEHEPAPSELQALLDAAGRAELPEPRDRQEQIVALSRKLVRDGRAGLAEYEQAVAPLLLANAVDAARLEIADLDAAVARARTRLGPRFDALHVVIVGAHMAREGEIAQQYFEKLFGEREGLRIVFAEGLWDEPAELSLLATHLLDQSIGEGFFGDGRRMHRDLLSDAAAQVLRER